MEELKLYFEDLQSKNKKMVKVIKKLQKEIGEEDDDLNELLKGQKEAEKMIQEVSGQIENGGASEEDIQRKIEEIKQKIHKSEKQAKRLMRNLK